MFFAKNELIELEDKNYIVLDSGILDNEAYYKVCEPDLKEEKLSEDIKYIKAIKEYGALYVEEINDLALIKKLDNIMES